MHEVDVQYKTETERRMSFLVNLLNEACDRYYNGLRIIMSNDEYNLFKNGLKDMEIALGIVLPNSPTQYKSNENTCNFCNCEKNSQFIAI